MIYKDTQGDTCHILRRGNIAGLRGCPYFPLYKGVDGGVEGVHILSFIMREKGGGDRMRGLKECVLKRG